MRHEFDVYNAMDPTEPTHSLLKKERGVGREPCVSLSPAFTPKCKGSSNGRRTCLPLQKEWCVCVLL